MKLALIIGFGVIIALMFFLLYKALKGLYRD